MNHSFIGCDIIRDLIPSYLDGLCSDGSERAVENHVQECDACREYLNALKGTRIVSGDSDRRELNYMRKVKKHYARNNAIGVALLFFLTLAILLTIPHLHFQKDFLLYCTLFSTLTLGTFFLLNNYQAGPPKSVPRIIAGIASMAGILYGIFLGFLLTHILRTGSGPFGLEPNRTGSFLHRQLIAVCILELLLFAYFAADAIRREHRPGILPTLNLMGCTLCMSYDSLLYDMEDYSFLSRELIRIGLLALAVGIAVAAITLLSLKLFRASGKEKQEPGI